MGYTHLTREERYTVKTLLSLGWSQRAIAAHLRRAPATISRELRRNGGARRYCAGVAHTLMLARRQVPRRQTFTPALRAVVATKLQANWSPEQIAGWLRQTGQPTVSHERIYQEVYADARAGGTLWQHLRGAHVRRRRRQPGRRRRGVIRNRRLIDARPALVHERVRLGDWEADLIVGAGHSDTHLVSCVDRVSKRLLLARVQSKQTRRVNAVLRTLFARLPAAQRQTLTVDNGKEFAAHERLAQQTGLTVYFAHPYHAWERGTNENTNRLIRQYFPKGTDFREVSDAAVAATEQQLNDRPRKGLGYQTPLQRAAQGDDLAAAPTAARTSLALSDGGPQKEWPQPQHQLPTQEHPQALDHPGVAPAPPPPASTAGVALVT